MADVYQFSESSLDLLQQCIAAGKQPGKKWLELFKPEAKENNAVNEDEDTILLSVKSPVESVTDSQGKKGGIDEATKLNLNLEKQEAVDKLCAVLEDASSNKLYELIAYCDYEVLLPDLANRLPVHNLQKICEELLESDIRAENIVINFFPALIKRSPTHNLLNLLVRAYKMYPETIIAVIQSVLTITDVPNILIGQFFIAVDEKVHLQFLESISTAGLPAEVFYHHLPTISQLYMKCEKTFEINYFILNGLLQTAQLGQEDRDYGRFMHVFFQSLNAKNNQISKQSLQLLVDSHKTPFKRLCQKILSQLN